MNEIELKQLARTIMTSLPVNATNMPNVRGFYAGDNRVPDWEQRFATIVASYPDISSVVAMIGDDWLMVAAVASDREPIAKLLDAAQELAPGQPSDPILPCMLAVAD